MSRFKIAGSFVSLVAAALPGLVAAAHEDESPRVAALRAAAPDARSAAAASFWKELDAGGTPLVEAIPGSPDRVRVTFLLRAALNEEESNAGLIGSFVPGGSRVLARFERVPGTEVLQKSFVVDSRSRYRYYLAWPQGRSEDAQATTRLTLDGLAYELFADPRSRLSFQDDESGTLVRTSYFDGPDAPQEPWLARSAAVASGSIETIDVQSRVLGNSRKISIYTPFGHAPRGGYPFLVLFDGEAYLRSVPAATILDNLIAARSLPPLVAVFVSPIDAEHRGVELRPNPAFASFIVDELLPRVRAKHPLSREPRRGVVGGSSLGGLASAAMAKAHPEIFGNVLSMSGSYWWYPAVEEREDEALAETQSGWLPRQYAARERLPLRFYVAVGLGEGEGMLAPNRLFRDVLTAKGNPLRYEEFHGDHSYLNWRDCLVSGLGFLLGTG